MKATQILDDIVLHVLADERDRVTELGRELESHTLQFSDLQVKVQKRIAALPAPRPENPTTRELDRALQRLRNRDHVVHQTWKRNGESGWKITNLGMETIK